MGSETLDDFATMRKESDATMRKESDATIAFTEELGTAVAYGPYPEFGGQGALKSYALWGGWDVAKSQAKNAGYAVLDDHRAVKKFEQLITKWNLTDSEVNAGFDRFSKVLAKSYPDYFPVPVFLNTPKVFVNRTFIRVEYPELLTKGCQITNYFKP